MSQNSNASPSPQEIKTRAGDIFYSCEGILRLDFFFDGLGYSIPEFRGVGSDISNIGKLFRAHEVNLEKFDRRAFYYPELGARFDPELAVIRDTATKKILKDAQDSVKDKLTPDNPVDKAKQEAIDYRKGKIKELKSNPTTQGVKDALTSVGKDADDMASRSIRHAGRIVERGAKASLDEAVRIARRKINGVASHWRWPVVDVASHPWRALKLACIEELLCWQGGKYVVSRFTEASRLRDIAPVAFLFNTVSATTLPAIAEQLGLFADSRQSPMIAPMKAHHNPTAQLVTLFALQKIAAKAKVGT